MSQIVEQYIEAGIDLIVAGDPAQAHRHFTYDSLDVEGLESRYSRGSLCLTIGRLKTEASVVKVSRALASESWCLDGGELMIPGWLGHDTEGVPTSRLEENPELYYPHLLPSFYHEAGVLAAEEWLHGQQKANQTPLSGIDDTEVDVAAYLYGRGVHLSADFLTRYAVRYKWCLDAHPERREELDAFIEIYGKPPY